jgi:hypothetical protein
MSRRLEKLIEQKAWETLTDYGYNDAHLLEQLTESVLERLYEANVPNPQGGNGYYIIGPDADGNYYVQWYRITPEGEFPIGEPQGPYGSRPTGNPPQIPGTGKATTSAKKFKQLKRQPAKTKTTSKVPSTASMASMKSEGYLYEDQHTPPGAEPGGFWYDYGGAYYYVFFRGTPPNMVKYYYFNGQVYQAGTGPLGGSGYPGTEAPLGSGLPDFSPTRSKGGFKPDLRTSAMKRGVSAGRMGRMGR